MVMQIRVLHHTSLNSLARWLLEQMIKGPSVQWLEETFTLMDKANDNSKGKNGRERISTVSKVFKRCRQVI